MTEPPDQHDWVLAAPFRAHLQHVQAATGLPWEALARAAGVSPTLIRHLVFGNNGRYPRRISPLTARQLVELTPARLPRVTAAGLPGMAAAELPTARAAVA